MRLVITYISSADQRARHTAERSDRREARVDYRLDERAHHARIWADAVRQLAAVVPGWLGLPKTPPAPDLEPPARW